MGLIEDCIRKYQKEYQKASGKQRKEGLLVIFGKSSDGSDHIVEWQKESIVFPFLPKKLVKGFETSTVFMSKQVPILVLAKVK